MAKTQKEKLKFEKEATTSFSHQDLEDSIKQLSDEINKLIQIKNPTSDAINSITKRLTEILAKQKHLAELTRQYISNLDQSDKINQQEIKVLERERARYKAIISSIGDGLVVTDTDEKVTLVNESFKQMLGLDIDEALGKQFSLLVRKENGVGMEIDRKDRLSYKALLTKKPQSSSIDSDSYFVRKNGTKFPIMEKANPIIYEGEVQGVVTVFRDITAEKEIDKAKNEFVSLASHQLRTPLAAINWYTEMLLDTGNKISNEELVSYVKEISKASQRMVDMVNAILNVSRLELGTFAIEPEYIDLLELLRKVVNEQKQDIIAKKHRLEILYNHQIPHFQSDHRLISMVFQNLLSNAIKYTPENGKIILRATLINDQKEILFSIQDNGFGIPKSEEPKIFQKLFRASNIRKHATEGNGLGLYIIKRILNILGGEIWFDSKINEGTTFFCTLPLDRAQQAKVGKPLNL